MVDAPRDGTRVLLKYKTRAYLNDRAGWGFSGEKWEECRGVSDKDRTGSDPHWQPWCGNARTHTTEHIRDEDTLEWMPLP
jgi:hypothetical protein